MVNSRKSKSLAKIQSQLQKVKVNSTVRFFLLSPSHYILISIFSFYYFLSIKLSILVIFILCEIFVPGDRAGHS